MNPRAMGSVERRTWQRHQRRRFLVTMPMPTLMALMRARMDDTRDERHFTTYDAVYYNILLYRLSTRLLRVLLRVLWRI